MIKKALQLLTYFSFTFLYSQNSDNHKIFINSNSLEFYANKESGFSNEEKRINKGFGIEFNTINGVLLFKKISISIGAGISFNIEENLKSLPVFGDVKWYLYNYGYNSPYILLNAGRNLKIDNFLSGQSSKFGVGYRFESDLDFFYLIEGFIKSKEYILNTTTNYNYQTTSLGISIGIGF